MGKLPRSTARRIDMSRRFPRSFAAESSQCGCNIHDGTKSSGKVAKLASERSSVEHGKYLGIVEPIPRKGWVNTSVGCPAVLPRCCPRHTESSLVTYRDLYRDLPRPLT